MSIEPVRTYVGNIDDDCHQIGVCMLARVRFATLAPPRKTYFCATEHHSSFAGVRLYRSADSLPLSICLCGRLSLLCLSDIDTGGDGDDNNKRTNGKGMHTVCQHNRELKCVFSMFCVLAVNTYIGLVAFQ